MPSDDVLVTGGAGFIGRWVVNRLLNDGHRVTVFDDLSSGRAENLRELEAHPGFAGLIQGDVKDEAQVRELFDTRDFSAVFHLAASINVQRSIDNPGPTFLNDALGTFRILEACREQYFARNGLDLSAHHFDFERDAPKLVDRRPRITVMSTCMVYDLAGDAPIPESHPYRPASPYAAAKIAADSLALSYAHSYGMPITVVRPFNTYGPFQRSDGEGGVVSIFLTRDLRREPMLVKGTGEQTRDLLYVEDCADFVVSAGYAPKAEGKIINAGTGSDVSIVALARACATQANEVKLVPHDHPQAEIARLCCDRSLAEQLLDWRPRINLEEGLRRTRDWLGENKWAW